MDLFGEHVSFFTFFYIRILDLVVRWRSGYHTSLSPTVWSDTSSTLSGHCQYDSNPVLINVNVNALPKVVGFFGVLRFPVSEKVDWDGWGEGPTVTDVCILCAAVVTLLSLANHKALGKQGNVGETWGPIYPKEKDSRFVTTWIIQYKLSNLEKVEGSLYLRR
jgi:hypothetical protein